MHGGVLCCSKNIVLASGYKDVAYIQHTWMCQHNIFYIYIYIIYIYIYIFFFIIYIHIYIYIYPYIQLYIYTNLESKNCNELGALFCSIMYRPQAT